MRFSENGLGLFYPKILLRQILAALTVSFVAISLGAAFGVMSGRGALAGILSAGVIAFIASLMGGTRIQCSGPTAPMTAVMIVLMSAVSGGILDDQQGASSRKFINLVLLLTGCLIVVSGLLRTGRLIRFVPSVIISGFMCGIAIMIWIAEIRSLFGIGDSQPYDGRIQVNAGIAVATLFISSSLPLVLRLVDRRLNSFLPASLVAIVLVTLFSVLFHLDVQRIALGESLASLNDLQDLFYQNVPTQWSIELIRIALPFAMQLAILAYLDTLMTSLVVDRKMKEVLGVKETTRANKELGAQGLANAAVSIFGGIPGAQATIRSVLIINEGATTRVTGVMVGVFILIEMVVLQDIISRIPQAVFSGILLKVGYDVFDRHPVQAILAKLKTKTFQEQSPQVSLSDAGFIIGTGLVTVLVNLSVAVIVFSLLYHIMQIVQKRMRINLR